MVEQWLFHSRYLGVHLMKIDTFIKLGSLAFGVARDEKVQELLKMAHKGAKRRGLLQPPTSPPWGNQGRK